RTIEEQAPGMLCSVLCLDGERLRHGAAPSLPEDYSRAVDGLTIGPAAGSCGTAAYRRERVIVDDIERDPRWAEFRDLALRHGLRACWSEPILSASGQVLGTFASYYGEARSPTDDEIALIEGAAQLGGLAIERKRAEAELAEARDQALEAARLKSQFLANLVGNAIKFTDQGEVVVRVRAEELTAGDVALHVTVSDTGIGIPGDKQERVFGAFVQVDGSMTRRHGGTGLGLAIASQLVELMGGRIWVESVPGRGSSFHFTVRLDRTGEDGARDDGLDAAALRGLRVLVVDDSATSRSILVDMLAAW